MVSGAQEVAVTVLGHPMRAGEMCLMNVLSTIGLFFGIESKDHADSFGPMRGVGLRIAYYAPLVGAWFGLYEAFRGALDSVGQ